MGYYTYHELETITEIDAVKLKEIEKYMLNNELEWQINKFNGNDVFMFTKEEDGDTVYLADEPRKWYESTADMKEMSIRFEDVLFKLHGEGEEAGDLWDEYYLNGKHQRCNAILTYEPFDENKLK